MTPIKAKAEPAPLWGFLKWFGKVLATAALGGITGAFAFYQTWTSMQTDVKAQGATIKVHTEQIQRLQDADVDQALSDAIAATKAESERDANREQLKQIREDLQYMQRELIGRIRR